MEGGCQVPIAGYAVKSGDDIVLTGLVASPDGKTIYKETITGRDPESVGYEAASRLSSQGAKALIDRVKEELDQ